MSEKFGDAALRHLETAEVLELEGRIDDAGYHYGLVGEMALKAAFEKAAGKILPKHLRLHINNKKTTLQKAIEKDSMVIGLLAAQRLGGALGAELRAKKLGARFANWSINIRYHHSDHCPVKPANIAAWKADALALYNNGVF